MSSLLHHNFGFRHLWHWYFNILHRHKTWINRRTIWHFWDMRHHLAHFCNLFNNDLFWLFANSFSHLTNSLDRIFQPRRNICTNRHFSLRFDLNSHFHWLRFRFLTGWRFFHCNNLLFSLFRSYLSIRTVLFYRFLVFRRILLIFFLGWWHEAGKRFCFCNEFLFNIILIRWLHYSFFLFCCFSAQDALRTWWWWRHHGRFRYKDCRHTLLMLRLSGHFFL